MVMRLFFFILFFGRLLAIPEDNLSVDVPWNEVQSGTPFPLTISVTHSASNPVKEGSFLLQGKPITPKYLKRVKIEEGSSLVIDIYQVEMPGQPVGLQMLPEISVEIGNKRVKSVPTGYDVKASVPVSAKSPILKLETFITSKEALYPGQRAYFGYRYLYNTSIDLTEETLPLIAAEGFKKVGDKRVDDGDERGFSIRQVAQRVQAINPGTFEFREGKIKGYAYTQDSSGNKKYFKPILEAISPSVSVTVLPFPEKGKPPSFQGAVGEFSFEARLLSNPIVQLGDHLKLELKVIGEEGLDEVQLNELCCEAGFSGFFKRGDLPISQEIKGKEKIFLVDLILINEDATAIPALEFSFFDPEKKTNKVLKSQKIPLEVKKAPLPKLIKEEKPKQEVVNPPIEGEPLGFIPSFSIPLAFAVMVSLGGIMIGVQRRKEEVKKKGNSLEEGLSELMRLETDEDAFYPRLETFLSELKNERADLKKQVDAFQEEVERFRFSKEKTGPKEILNRLNTLFKR